MYVCMHNTVCRHSRKSRLHIQHTSIKKLNTWSPNPHRQIIFLLTIIVPFNLKKVLAKCVVRNNNMVPFNPKADSVLSCVQSFATLWTVAHQTPLSMGILQARILELVAFPFSRASSQIRDWTQVSHTVGGFFTICATREVLVLETTNWGGLNDTSGADNSLSSTSPGRSYGRDGWLLMTMTQRSFTSGKSK